MRIHARLIAAYGAIVVTSAVLLASATQAADKAPAPAMMAPITTGFMGFNSGNAAMWNSPYTADAVIVDEFPPYRWDSPGAGAKWWVDFHNWAKSNKINKAHVAAGAVKFWSMKGGRAYVVVPTTFTAVQNGKPITETGTLTFVLVKNANKWMAQGWTWGETSAH